MYSREYRCDDNLIIDITVMIVAEIMMTDDNDGNHPSAKRNMYDYIKLYVII